MTNRPKRPRDPAQLAKLIVDIATGEVEDQQAKPHQQRKRGARSTQTGGRMAMRSWRVLLRGFFAPIFVAAIVLSASTSSWADGQPKRVLMLHSFGLRFKPWTDYAEQIRTEIGRRKSVDFHDHSLLGARVDDPKSEGPFIAYLSALNADQPPDLNGDRGTRRKLCAAAPQRSLSKCSNGPHCRRAAEGRPQQAHRERHGSGNVQ